VSKTIDLVKAHLDEENARKKKERIELELRQAACEKAFEPIMQMWEEVKDLPARRYRDPKEIVTMKDNVASSSKSGLVFWNSSGNFGDSFLCEWGEHGTEYRMGYGLGKSKHNVVTLEELRKGFVKCLAMFLLIEESEGQEGSHKLAKRFGTANAPGTCRTQQSKE